MLQIVSPASLLCALHGDEAGGAGLLQMVLHPEVRPFWHHHDHHCTGPARCAYPMFGRAMHATLLPWSFTGYVVGAWSARTCWLPCTAAEGKPCAPHLLLLPGTLCTCGRSHKVSDVIYAWCLRLLISDCRVWSRPSVFCRCNSATTPILGSEFQALQALAKTSTT